MPPKKDDATPGVKLLRMFQILMCDGRRQFQKDLADRLNCSPQVVMRLAQSIESVVGTNFEMGTENRRKWYRLRTSNKHCLGLRFEELRYISVCRDLAASTLPHNILQRIDDSILNLSILMADRGNGENGSIPQQQFTFCSKGRINYSNQFGVIETLIAAAENRRICLVRYKAGSRAQVKEHRFAPGRIASMNGVLYALGAGVTEDYSAIKHLTNLAVHRILEARLTEHSFSFELPSSTENTFGLPWHEPRTFRIHFSQAVADYIRERTWADVQHLDDREDGSVVLEITTRSEPELKAWIRSFGETVIAFDEIAQEQTHLE